MYLAPGETYRGQFAVHRIDTGAASDADSLPTAAAYKNGTLDGAYTITVTNITTGLYKVSGAVPSGYVVGDTIEVAVSYAVNAVSQVQCLPLNKVDAGYHADISFIQDTAAEEYSVTWFKNGVRVTSGITLPLIQVVKRLDGTDLVASTAMTQIGSTGSYKYDEATNLVGDGQAALCLVTATIDSVARTWSRVIGRDA